MYVVNKTTNDMIGYTVADTELTGSPHITSGYHTIDSPAQLLWKIHIPHDQEIIDVKSHRNIGNNIAYTLYHM